MPRLGIKMGGHKERRGVTRETRGAGNALGPFPPRMPQEAPRTPLGARFGGRTGISPCARFAGL